MPAAATPVIGRRRTPRSPAGISSVGPGSASRGRTVFTVGKRPRFIKTGGLRENSSLGRGISTSESDSRARGTMDRGMSGDSEYDASPDSTSRGRSWSVPAKFNSSFSRGISSDSRGRDPSSSNGRIPRFGKWKSKIVAPEQDDGTEMPLPGAVT